MRRYNHRIMHSTTVHFTLRYALAVLALSSGAVLQAVPAKARSLAIEYTGLVQEIPAGTGQLDFWMPVPHDDPYQQITNLEVESTHRYEINTDAFGNRILHLRLDHAQAGKLQVTLRFNAIRREHRQDLLHVSAGSVEANTGDVERSLKPDRLVPLDDQIRAWAREVADAAHAKTDLEMARAIYNHVVATVKYDKSGKGWGRGDIYYACETAPISTQFLSAMPGRSAFRRVSPSDFRCRLTGDRARSPAITVGRSFMPRASAGFPSTPPRPPKIQRAANIFLARTTKTASNFRVAATWFSTLHKPANH